MMLQRTVVAVLAVIGFLLLAAASALAADSGGSPPPAVAPSSGFPGSTGPPRQALEEVRIRDQRLRESWRSETSVAERKRLRRQYKDLSGDDARALAVQQHPSALLPKVWAPLRGVQRRGDYLDSYSARVRMPNGTNAVAVSTLPLRAADDSGQQRPVDLELVAGSSGLRPKNPLVETVFPSRSSDPVRVGDIGFELGGDAPVQLENDRAFYADAGGKDIDLFVMPTPSGVESFAQIRSVDAPEQVRMPFDLPVGTTLRSSLSAALEVVRGKETIATVSRPTAVDAQQRPVPVSYRVEGDDLVMTVKHRSGDFAMPIMVDPTIAYGWNSSPRRFDAAGWGGYQSNPASRWCSYFGDSYLGYGQYTYGRPQSNFPCAATSYAPYEIYEFNYYGEYSRGSTAFVEGWDEGYNFDIVSGAACHYSGIYSAGLNRFESYSGNECSDVWNNTRYHRASGTPPNYAVFGTVINGGGPGQDFTNQLWGATVFVSDREPPTTEQGPRRIATSWTNDTTFDVTARDTGIGVDWTEVKISAPGRADQFQSVTHPCSADPANHCPSSDSFAYTTNSMREGINTVSAKAGDLIRHGPVRELGTFRIDRTAPPAPVLSGDFIEDENKQLNGLALFEAAASDALSGVESLIFTIDGKVAEEVSNRCTTDGCALRHPDFGVDSSDLTDGPHTASLFAKDRAGNRGLSATFQFSTGSGPTPAPPPTTDADRRSRVYSPMHLGPSFDGLASTGAVAVELNGYDGLPPQSEVTYVYGDCSLDDSPEGCVTPLQIQTSAVCSAHLGLYGLEASEFIRTQIRNAPAVRYDEGKTIEVYSGTTVVSIYGDTAARATAAAERFGPAGADEIPVPGRQLASVTTTPVVNSDLSGTTDAPIESTGGC